MWIVAQVSEAAIAEHWICVGNNGEAARIDSFDFIYSLSDVAFVHISM